MSLEGLHLPGAVLGHLIGVLKMLSNQSRARCICQRQWKSNCSLMLTFHTHNTRICTTNTQYGHCSSTRCRHTFHTHAYHIHGVFICTGTTHMRVTHRHLDVQYMHNTHGQYMHTCHNLTCTTYHPPPQLRHFMLSTLHHTHDLCEHVPAHTLHTQCIHVWWPVLAIIRDTTRWHHDTFIWAFLLVYIVVLQV